ncbi:MAG: hypothetical protein JWQ39_875 [Glaciihabitans sp.]|jgi:uncharacterized protein|nr:hypothetical protein [Glaciihabitans sp.]MCW2654443.1 hypothetical protein [Mycobacterium sp.]
MATQTSAAIHRTPRSALTYDVLRLPRRPGAMIAVHETVESPARIGLDMIAIDRGAPLELDLQFQSVSEGVLVTGTVSAPTSGECARCLTATAGRVAISITELFAYPDSTTEATTEEDEVGHVVEGTVDLEQPIIDAVGLELPLSPLCSEDCPGLCAVCGVALAEAEPGHHHDQVDPRWAKLAGMFTEDPAGDDR